MRKAAYLTAAVVVLLGFATAWADDGVGESSINQACISTDPNTGDSAAWAIRAVGLFTEEQYADAVTTVNACFKHWGPVAGQQQKALYDGGQSVRASAKSVDGSKERSTRTAF
jgi:hypothetical protein